MEQGIYEQIINKLISHKLENLDSDTFHIKTVQIDKAEAAFYLSEYCKKVINKALLLYTTNNALQEQVALVNNIILHLVSQLKEIDFEEDLIGIESKILKAVYSKIDPEFSNFDEYLNEVYPFSRLTQSELFSGGKELSINSELKKEILSSDRVDLLISFIKWSGLRILKPELDKFTKRGGKLRVLTTTYIGATDFKAIDYLSSLPNTEIKVSYNERNERLHAKAYIFYRNTGFHTAYIGSSNLSKSALTSGLEWNLKITSSEISHVIQKVQKKFNSHWTENSFEPYDSSNDSEKLRTRLKSARSGFSNSQEMDVYFEFDPRPFQKTILEEIEVERLEHNSWRNLIVAATGTGKTMIAAFDFKNFRYKNPNARILFVAHRQEIIKQALVQFRSVLKDNNFGELWGGGLLPSSYNAVFATIQTLKSQLNDIKLSAEFYDYIIIDEVHHATASSYRPIINYFNPKILLGLTATPERMDGEDITKDFNNRIASEIRLPDALNTKILCPFQYFAISDSIDLKNVSWVNGRYDISELTDIYTRNDTRVGEIIKSLKTYLTDEHDVRALGFCASQEHAHYMAEKFTLAGFKADYLVSNGGANRDNVKSRLVNQEINYLFVVDIFNEGVDIPEIDTVLFLRPTESLTVFLQQLGRGLRLLSDSNPIKKEVLTVLDYVGNSRPEYDYESKFRALVGRINHSVDVEVEKNFPNVPLGCSIVLERAAKERILSNIKKALVSRKSIIVNKISTYRHHTNLTLTLSNFIKINNIPIQKIYHWDTWSSLCHQAGVLKEFSDINNSEVYKAVKQKWLSTQSISYFRFIKKMAKRNFKIQVDKLDIVEQKMCLMLAYDVWQDLNQFKSLDECINAIGNNSILVSEIFELMDILIDQIKFKEIELELPFAQPLRVHSRYTRDQILAAFDLHTFSKKSSNREGVAENKDLNVEVLFVDLNKTEEEYSPTTMYNDYAINELLFHWQTQNSARPDIGKGLSYIKHEEQEKIILLFTREYKKNEYKATMGYVFLGRAKYQSHYGSKPMSIEWKLQEPIPNYLWSEAAKLSVG